MAGGCAPSHGSAVRVLLAAALISGCAPMAEPPQQAPSAAPASGVLGAQWGRPESRSPKPSPSAAPAPTRSPTPAASPSSPGSPAISYASDYCVVRDWLTPYHAYDEHQWTVLDTTYALPPDYEPPDLVPVSSVGFASERGDELVREVVVRDLAELHAAAADAGLMLLVESGYRSYADQQTTFDAWVARIGYEAALQRVARPGHSEHQLGTSLDFTSPGWTGRFGDWAVETAEGAWLAEHAASFGFVMSYPAGADGVTCYGYEPWHYRWIGRALAAKWAAEWATRGMTLRDLLVREGSQGAPEPRLDE